MCFLQQSFEKVELWGVFSLSLSLTRTDTHSHAHNIKEKAEELWRERKRESVCVCVCVCVWTMMRRSEGGSLSGKEKNVNTEKNVAKRCKIQWNSVITNSVVNEHLVITNRFQEQFGHFTTQINPVITNPGYNKNGRSRAVRYILVWLYFKFNKIQILLNIMRVFILTQLFIKEFVNWFSLRHGLNWLPFHFSPKSVKLL